MNNKYCPDCKTKLRLDEAEYYFVCDSCGYWETNNFKEDVK